jgi:hypothetical protein
MTAIRMLVKSKLMIPSGEGGDDDDDDDRISPFHHQELYDFKRNASILYIYIYIYRVISRKGLSHNS